MRARDGTLSFAPRLPRTLSLLAFRVRYRNRRIAVKLARDGISYELLEGDPIDVVHHGTPFELARAPVTHDLPDHLAVEPVRHPHGRAPLRRRDLRDASFAPDSASPSDASGRLDPVRA
jgi:alpha,alpha-trehalose phosphorylase